MVQLAAVFSAKPPPAPGFAALLDWRPAFRAFVDRRVRVVPLCVIVPHTAFAAAEFLPRDVARWRKALPTIQTGQFIRHDAIPLVRFFHLTTPGKVHDYLTLTDNLPEIIMSGPKIIMALIEGLISAIPDLVQAVPTLIKSIVDTFLNYDWGSIGRNIVSGIKNGVSNTWNGLKSGVGTAVNGLVGGVESILGIASPSKVFARIGGYMAEGLGQGFDREMTDVRKNIEDQMTFGTTSFSVSGAAKSSVGVVNGLLANNQPSGLTQVNLVVDGQTLARVLFDPLRGEILQRGVSLA